MVRCLAILFLFVLPALNVAQCPQPNATTFEDLDCATSKGSITVTPGAGAVAPFTYSWTSSVSTTSVATNLNSGQYNIIIKDANNCTFIGQHNLNLTNLMNISFSLSPTNTITCFGANNGAITATVGGTSAVPPFTYTWSNGSNNNSITNLSSGVYTLTAKDFDGCTTTNTFNVLEPAQINTTINNSVSCFGGTVNAVLSTTGGIGNLSYTVNGVPIGGSIIANATAGNYTVITKDGNNCTQTKIIALNQPSSPVFNFIPTQPSCPTSSNGGLNVTISNMQSPYNYTWTAPMSINPFISNIPQGIYSLTVKDANNCIFTNTFHLLPVSNLQPNFNSKPETCSAADAAVTINISGGAAPYTYSLSPFPSQSANTFSNLSTGVHTVIITDANTCSLVATFSIGNTSPVLISTTFTDILCYNTCDGKAIVSTSFAVAPITYSLTNLPTYTTNTLTNICAGTYTLKAVDNIGCYAITTLTFTDPAPYNFSVSGNSQICISKTASLTAQVSGGTTPYSYFWFPGSMNTVSVTVSPTTTTIYSLNVYDGNGCTLSPEVFTVNVSAPLIVSVSPQNSGICPGTTAQITPSVSGGDGNYTYLWLPGNLNTSSIFLSNLTNPTYTYIVNDGCGSPTNTTIINLQIFPVTIPTFSTDTQIGCQPLCVQFKNTTSSSTSHYWNFGDVPFEQGVEDPFYCYTRSGQFNVKLSLTDNNGCKVNATYSNYINVLSQPIPDFITKPGVLTDDIGQGQLLNASGNTTSLKWFIDNVYQGNSNNITVPCTDTVCYLIKLIADNSSGCKDSLERLICVKPGFTFYMPNSFTPNNNGLNDELLPYGRSWISDNYKFRVFDRWGHMVFQTNDLAKGWDGKVKGATPINDTFFWMVNVTDYYGDEHSYQGTVVIVK